MRTIAVVNQSTLLANEDVVRCVAALQTQVSRDFAATWGLDARLRVTDEAGDDEEALYLLDDGVQANALGLHTRTANERPCGFGLVRLCLDAGDSWQATA